MKLVLAILVAVVFAIAIVAAVRFFGHRSAGGFRDWVKNPAYREAMAERLAARQALTVPDDISADAIAKMVERLFVEPDDDFNFDRLELVGNKAVPLLIRALADPRTATTNWGLERGHALSTRSPLERICNLLAPFGPPAAAPPLAKFVDSEDDYFRQQAAEALGNIGTADCIGPVSKFLDDNNDYVRASAMDSIRLGLETRRSQQEFLEAMFPAVARLLDRDDSTVGGSAPDLLLAIDADRALPILLSPQYFTTSNGQLQYILQTLNRAGRKVPHGQLLPLLTELAPKTSEYLSDYAYAAALVAYAHNPDEAAERTVRAALDSANDVIKRAAGEALEILAGLTDLRSVAFEHLKRTEFNALAEPLQFYLAVCIYDAEVNNGGHSQYFVNSSGDHWRAALRGLAAVGAAERAAILREAVALFSPAGPSENNEARHQQVATFSKAKDAALDALDDRYYACRENVETLLSLYAIENKAHFRSPPE